MVQVEYHQQDVSCYTCSHRAYTVLPQIDDVQCHHLVKTLAQLTTRSNSLWYSSAAQLHTTKQYCKIGMKKHRKHSPGAIYHLILSKISSNNQTFELLPWQPSEDANVVMQLDVISNMLISSDSFSTVSQELIWVTGDALCVTWRIS